MSHEGFYHCETTDNNMLVGKSLAAGSFVDVKFQMIVVWKVVICGSCFNFMNSFP